MYSKGSFIRSESGRVVKTDEGWGCNASRKDVRDAVAAALAAQPAWAQTRALLKGFILYRLGESLAQRADIPGHDLAAARAVWWAGWAEKLPLIASSVNPVSSHLVVSTIEPVGVVGAPVSGSTAEDVCRNVVDALSAALCAGCTITIMVPTKFADLIQSLAEVLHVSDIPAGCVNLLTSDDIDALSTLFSHGDVALSETGHLHAWGMDRPSAVSFGDSHLQRNPAGLVEDSPRRALSMCDTKTVWHPIHI